MSNNPRMSNFFSIFDTILYYQSFTFNLKYDIISCISLIYSQLLVAILSHKYQQSLYHPFSLLSITLSQKYYQSLHHFQCYTITRISPTFATSQNSSLFHDLSHTPLLPNTLHLARQRSREILEPKWCKTPWNTMGAFFNQAAMKITISALQKLVNYCRIMMNLFIYRMSDLVKLFLNLVNSFRIWIFWMEKFAVITTTPNNNATILLQNFQ